ncbi:hypothetical protein AB0J42_29375 [Nonomuraea sp. NPDC049649]
MTIIVAACSVRWDVDYSVSDVDCPMMRDRVSVVLLGPRLRASSAGC